MKREVIAALLCAALGAAYALQLTAQARAREAECRRDSTEAIATLALAATRLHDADRALGPCLYAAGWYQSAYLQSRGLR